MSDMTERTVEIPWMIDILGGLSYEGGPDVLYVGFDGEFSVVGHIRSMGCNLDVMDVRHADGVNIVADAAVGIPAQDGKYDVVVCISTIDHIGEANYQMRQSRDPDTDKAQALVEMRRVLKPGGMLLLTAPVGKPGRYPWDNFGVIEEQRVFGHREWLDLFGCSRMFDVYDERYWVMVGEKYVECDPMDVYAVEYQRIRAGAVGALALMRR